MHFNELPLRYLFERLDFLTFGSKLFSGLIEKSLEGCHDLPVIGFEAIDWSLPNVDVQVLSKDQNYLFRISDAVRSGCCSPDLAVSDLGNLNHSRWLTAANNILRLYISTEELSDSLKLLVTFILTCYVPMWFAVKTKIP